ncbi:hypothetical protein SDC9_168091 [bioreactor metagenome]|uniref:Uncharacterized protein n=1 Tax=bioreactor metagenome TaxID=1076179 RepID=A0A645G441_9ZZZZ
MAGHHDGGASVQRHLDAGDGSANARIFRDLAVIVLRNIQIGADKNALSGSLALSADVGKTKNMHDGFSEMELRRSASAVMTRT